jgi:hypothetical protein
MRYAAGLEPVSETDIRAIKWLSKIGRLDEVVLRLRGQMVVVGSGPGASNVATIVRKTVMPWAHAIYQRELRKSPDKRGKVVVKFNVGTSGNVTAVVVSEDTLGIPAVTRGINVMLNQQKFPASAAGDQTFTFVFA